MGAICNRYIDFIKIGSENFMNEPCVIASIR